MLSLYYQDTQNKKRLRARYRYGATGLAVGFILGVLLMFLIDM